ncbi:MAG: MBL fold metallo-hydrolase [Polyangiaceae bacterium]
MTTPKNLPVVRVLGVDTWMFRQPIHTHFEAPHVFLLVGKETALLVDSGTGDFDFRDAIAAVLDEAYRTDGFRRHLLVVHTHGHSDHVGGDALLRGWRGARIVPADVPSLTSFLGLGRWPLGRGVLELGDRPVDVLPIPGHSSDHVAFFDRRSGLLLTGDTLYPGRITVREARAFRASIARLADFARDVRPSALYGSHVERDLHGHDYAIGATTHPDEAPLALPVSALFEMERVVDAGVPRGPRRLRSCTLVPIGEEREHRTWPMASTPRPGAGTGASLLVSRTPYVRA